MLTTLVSHSFTLRTVIDLLVLIVAGVIFGFQFITGKSRQTILKKHLPVRPHFMLPDLINIVFHHSVDVTLVTFLSESLKYQ